MCNHENERQDARGETTVNISTPRRVSGFARHLTRGRSMGVRFRGAPWKGGAFQWVRVPPGEMLQPDATGATVEVTKRLKPLVTNASRNTVTWRVYRP